MKRADIEIGVEYAETGALAYGREPSVRPKKIRFTSKIPSVQVWTATVIEEKPLHVNLPTNDATVRRLRRDHAAPGEIIAWADLPDDVVSQTEARHLKFTAQPGTVVRYYTSDDRTYLPCERYLLLDSGGSGWVPGLARLADVHRTWASLAEQEQERARERAERERPRHELQDRLDALGLGDFADAVLAGSVARIEIRSANVPAFLEWAQSKGAGSGTR